MLQTLKNFRCPVFCKAIYNNSQDKRPMTLEIPQSEDPSISCIDIDKIDKPKTDALRGHRKNIQ